MKLLVLGGGVFLGRAVVDSALRDGHDATRRHHPVTASLCTWTELGDTLKIALNGVQLTRERESE